MFLHEVMHYGNLLFLNHVVSHIPCWAIRRAFYKLSGMKIGEGSRILMGTRVQCPNQIVIGSSTYINENCHLDGRGKLTIGNNVNISNYSAIVSAGHDMKSDTFSYRTGEVIIEDFCWLGTRSIVLDRTHLKEGVVLGAGSVLKGDTESDSVYNGVPAVKTKSRDLAGPYDIAWKPYFV